MASSTADFATSVPVNFDDWTRDGEPAIFDETSLYQYINGGAELYISYGFSQLVAMRYTSASQDDHTIGDEIKVDIFDMGSSEDAYGVFSHGRESISSEVGQASEYAEGLLTFWKDRYYVSLLCYPISEDKRRILYRIAEAIAAAIPNAGPPPSIISRLPREGLVPESVKFFRHHIWLNSHFFVSNENILKIGKQTDAVLSRYGTEAERHFLLLIEYPSQERAEQAAASFSRHYMRPDEGPVQELENDRWTAWQRNGRSLAVVFDAASAENAKSTLKRVRPSDD